MRNLEAFRERYLRDPVSIRLGNLAANLARIESFSDSDKLRPAVEYLIVESSSFIAWTAADADLQAQAELGELHQQLTEWQKTLPDFWPDSARRASVAHKAGEWSRRVLAVSGLLDWAESRG